MKHVNIKGFDVIEAAGTYDEAQAFVNEVNAQAIGGNADWVMPDTVTLLCLQKLAPADAWVWSSSPYVGDSINAWGVNFDVDYVLSVSRNVSLDVRLVRAGQLLELGIAGHRASIEAAGIVLAEQPAQQEPLATLFGSLPVYDTAPQAQRKPLTYQEIWEVIRPLTKSDEVCAALVRISIDEYRAIEAVHGIKENT